MEQISEVLIQILILGGLSLLLTMILTPTYTYFAYKYKLWKQQREGAATGEKATVFYKLHEEKHRRHIPTMAGMVFIIAITTVTLTMNLDRSQTWLPLAALLFGAIVGLIDDIINLNSRGAGLAGMRPLVKLALIAASGLILGWFFYAKLGATAINVPFLGEWDIGWFIVPVFAFIVISVGNAVNITDGLDGLSGGLLVMAFGAFGIIALLQGNFGVAGFCATIIGALISYLWFNIFPARFFMGDVGSFGLGVSLGVVAMLTNTLFLLPIVGGIFVIEAGSSLVQISSKKLRHGKKLFLSAPFHQHLLAKGWPEVKVTMRFWLLGGILAIIGLLLALEGGMI
jgi:phospho-N-acetylmuramoyl-pentapeptide-transferase